MRRDGLPGAAETIPVPGVERAGRGTGRADGRQWRTLEHGRERLNEGWQNFGEVRRACAVVSTSGEERGARYWGMVSPGLENAR